jgi:hypothetical protein
MERKGIRARAVVLLLLSWAPPGAPAARAADGDADAAAGGWEVSGALAAPSSAHTSTALPDGSAVVCGGQAPDGAPLARCERWDPVTQRWRSAGTLAEARAHHVAVALSDGRVAVVGGQGVRADGAPAHEPTRALELFDPARARSTATQTLPFVPHAPLVRRLPDGDLLVMQGTPGRGAAVPARLEATIWAPARGTFQPLEIPVPGTADPPQLLVDTAGTLTLLGYRRPEDRCKQVTLWRRPAGEAWKVAHVQQVPGCVEAFLLGDRRVVLWGNGRYGDSPAYAIVVTPETRGVGLLPLPTRKPLAQIVPLGPDRLLAIEQSPTNAYLYEGSRGWRPAGRASSGGRAADFAPLPDGRVLVVAASGENAALWSPAGAPTRASCAGPLAFLEGLRSPAAELRSRVGLDPARIHPECRAALRAGPDAALSRALRALAHGPAGAPRDAAVRLLCALAPPWAGAELALGLAPGAFADDRERAVCLAALARSEAPADLRRVDEYLAEHTYDGPRVSEVLLRAAEEAPRLRAHAATLLPLAWERRSPGFDGLRRVVCAPEPIPSVADLCRRARDDQEAWWERAPRRRAAWVKTAAWTAGWAGVVALGYGLRDGTGGRAVATVASTLGGGRLLQSAFGSNEDGPIAAAFSGPLGVLGFVVGGVAGGVVGSLAARSPGAPRVATTALGASLFTAVTLAGVWDF